MDSVKQQETDGEKSTDNAGAVFDAAAIFADKKDSVVNIISRGSNGGSSSFAVGSGFFIAADPEKSSCRIATVNHSVVPSSRLNLESIEVQLDNGSKYSAKLSGQDLANDLAYLTIEGVSDPEKLCPTLKVSSESAKEGDPAVRISRMPREAEFFQGKFSSVIDRKDLDLILLDGEDSQRQLYKFDLHNNRDRAFGGAPVLNSQGDVIALHAGGLSGTESLAVPASKLSIAEAKQEHK